jgi:hypothetical protein
VRILLVCCPVVGVKGLESFRYEVFNRAANELDVSIAEKRMSGLVRPHNISLAIDDEESIRSDIEQIAKRKTL